MGGGLGGAGAGLEEAAQLAAAEVAAAGLGLAGHGLEGGRGLVVVGGNRAQVPATGRWPGGHAAQVGDDRVAEVGESGKGSALVEQD